MQKTELYPEGQLKFYPEPTRKVRRAGKTLEVPQGYIDFLYTGKLFIKGEHGKTEDVQRVFRLPLDHNATTPYNVLRYLNKGYQIIGAVVLPDELSEEPSENAIEIQKIVDREWDRDSSIQAEVEKRVAEALTVKEKAAAKRAAKEDKAAE